MIKRRIVGLILLCIASLAIAMALERWTESLGWPRWPTVARNTFSEAQVASVAILAALAPRRPFVGVTIIFAFHAMCFLAELGFGTQHSFSRWSTIESIANEAVAAMAAFVIVQGLRLFLGCRITADRYFESAPRGQFHLAALVEWMASWCVVLGLNYASGSWLIASRSNAATFAVTLLGWLIFGIPIAYLLLRPKLNAAALALLIVTGICATPLWIFAQVSYLRLSLILQLWPQGVWAGFVFWCFLIAHFLALRLLGYRWLLRHN